MKKTLRSIASISAVIFTLPLAACGGGGASSTPPPPTPAPTPAPTPPPTPPPTTANADLINLSLSESFTNDAALGTGTFPKNGNASNSTAAKSSLTVVYDSASRSYILTGGNLTQTFRPTDESASDAASTTYTRTSGSTTDTLLLTKPGTTGKLTYKYVGAGFWQHTVDGSASIDASITAFTYGVETPDASLPRTGSAAYSVDLIGSSGPTGYAGDGVLSADFATARFNVDIDVKEILDGGVIAPNIRKFLGDGTISADSNTFLGSFSLNVVNNFQGSLNGRFYGPGAEEVGATFYGNGVGIPGTAIVGTITGRKTSAANGKNSTITNLAFSEAFTGLETGGYYATNISNSNYRDGFAGGRTSATLAYEKADQSFGFSIYGGDTSNSFLASQRSVSPDGRFLIYDQGNGSRLLLYRPGSGNTELALTYASFAVWERAGDETSYDRRLVRLAYLPWGVRTQNVPLTGSANYEGILHGIGIGDSDAFNLSGSVTFAANFANASLTGTLHPIGTAVTDGRTADFGTFAFDALIDAANATFSGNIDFARYRGSAYIGGGFYGIGAAEIAAAFGGIRTSDPGRPGVETTLLGAVVAKKK